MSEVWKMARCEFCLVVAAISCCCAGGPAAEAAFRAADAIVVWNPGTGINEAGRKLTKAALADLTNALAKVTGTVPAVYAEGEEPSGAKAATTIRGSTRSIPPPQPCGP